MTVSTGLMGVDTDNRDFIDTNTAQKMGAEDVIAMKEGGASGQEIIQVCVAALLAVVLKAIMA